MTTVYRIRIERQADNNNKKKMSINMAASTVNVHGFTVIRTKLRMSSSDDECHYIYIAEHRVRAANDGKPLGKTLFVLSVPPYCDKACLERLFGDCGPIESVSIQAKPVSKQELQQDTMVSPSLFFDQYPMFNQGYQVAYVVFKKKASLNNALKMSYADIRVLFVDETHTPAGINKWCQEYSRLRTPPDADLLQKEIDTYMGIYDRQQAQKLEEALQKEAVPDEDGWVTVSRYGKNKGIPRTEGQETKIKLKDKKRNKEKELLHFYAYQIRESKKDYVAQLRQKFEEDKQKIAMMKSARKFRPY